MGSFLTSTWARTKMFNVNERNGIFGETEQNKNHSSFLGASRT